MLPKQVENWNRTEREYPLEKPITWFLEAQAEKTPDLPAVRFEGTSITYRELHRRVNKLARALAVRGVGTDSLVGVYMDRSTEMVVALLGIVKAGGAYVPFDPDYPADRLAFMFEDSAVSTVITQRRYEGQGLPKGIQPLFLDDPEWVTTTEADAVNPPLASRADSACYMIYTSGSTGKPKGVINVHQGLVNRILWMQDEYQLTPADRVLQKTPYSFDVSVWEFFWPLITGAQIIMAQPGGHKDNGYLLDTIVKEGVTTMHFVPSMLNLFTGAEGLDKITSLRQVMSSGEALPLALTLRFFEKLPNTRLHNLYGPTEAAIDVTYWECKADSHRNVVPIGHPIANIQMYILDEQMNAVPVGEEGELHIGGIGLARGYWNRPELTAQRFVPNPFGPEGSRLYKTGDLARYLPDGAIEYLGRLDFQIKLRGFRIELGEIEAVLLKHPGIAETVIVASEDALEEKQLVAYCVAKGTQRPTVQDLKKSLLADLPEYMVPARFIFLAEMPLLPNGKVNRKALPKDLQERPELAEMYVAPRTADEKTLVRIWGGLLNLKEVGTRDNFFDLGGNSLMALRLAAELKKEWKRDIPVVKVFQYPTVERLAQHLGDEADEGQKLLDGVFERATRIRIGRFTDGDTDGVAVIGMVGRFPGATNIDQLWQNLVDGVESIDRFSPEDLAEVDDETKNDPNYVPTRGIVADADKFDAPFFGIGPLEAKVMDPQQRVFLELAWAALENAGYDPDQFPGMIGVFAGIGDNHYYPNHVLGHPDVIKTVGKMIVGYGNEKDYVATRASYHLNLTGPSVSANTGCSTSLLSVDHAFKSLIDFECDMALAGGVDLFFPQKSGQLYEEGGTFTKDGHCRPFDDEATGTMFCDGAGIVVLRRLEDAIAAGDKIYAVVRGVAKNNDGANKVSFLAPSVEGQAQVIALAQAQANTPAETIGYVEAHGTGTPLGDPIEIEALTKAFRATTDKTQFCHIGSIKGNIGHPTIASGVAGFMKAALSLHHEVIPGTLNFRTPNSKIDFAHSPFKVVKETTPWPRTSTPRRASVSSFGFGGTNVHAILEEAPVLTPSGPSRPQQVLVLSAKTEVALGRQRRQLADFLSAHPETNLADASFTLSLGRKHHAFRDFVVAADAAGAAAKLGTTAERKAAKLANLNPEIVFLFPGQGSQYVNMGLSLYAEEPVFRQWVDTCCDILRPHLDRDLRELLFPAEGDEATAAESLKNTYYTQPALFTIEYALAQWWLSLGIQPSALVGHSVGEFVAACVAGIATVEELLPMVALRGRLIRDLPRGSMLSVRVPADQVVPRLPADIQLAASNSPNLCVVAGPTASITAFAAVLESEGVAAKELHTSHAFHSAMMDPVVGTYVEAMAKVTFSQGRIPILSTCLGEWLTDEVASSAEYWGRHLRMPVLFSNAVTRLLEDPSRVFLEVGPRDVLTTLTRQHVELPHRDRMVASLSGSPEDGAEWAALMGAVGQLWQNGVTIPWLTFFGRERRGRIPLPTYPFERTSHWLAPRALAAVGQAVPVAIASAPVPTTPTPGPAASDPIFDVLRGMLQDSLGVTLGLEDQDTPFLALGADSLMLMQLGRMVQSRYQFPVSFRQLVEQYSSPRLLVEALRAVAKDGDKTVPVVGLPTESARTVLGDPSTILAGFDPSGRPGWYLPDPTRAGRFVRVNGAGQRTEAGFLYPVEEVAEGPSALPGSRSILVSPAQQALWGTTRSGPRGAEANIAQGESFSVRIQGKVKDGAIRQAVLALSRLHEALRSRFSPDGAHLIIDSDPRTTVVELDLTSRPPSDRPAALTEFQNTAARTPFDLEAGPLFRVTNIRVADDERVILLAAHRTVCDGWSLDVLLEDFSKLYSAYAGEAPFPPVPRTGLADYLTYQTTEAYRRRSVADQAYWQKALDGVPARTRRPGLSAVHGTLRLSPAVVEGLRAMARGQGLSLFVVLLAGFAVQLHRRTPTQDHLIGVPIAGHPEAAMEDAIGALATVVPVRLAASEGQAFRDFCQQVHSQVLTGREHTAYGVLGPEGDSPAPVAFSHTHKYSAERLRFAGCQSDYQLNPRAYETYDLSLNVIESEDSLELLAHSNVALGDATWLKTWLSDLEQVLAGACSTPDATIGGMVSGAPGDVQAAPGQVVVVDPPIIIYLQKGQQHQEPLLCLMGIQIYFDLAKAMGEAIPVVGIHVPMMHRANERPSMDQITQHYLEAVQKVQPRGPYHLAGLCLGGMVAYEVARRLQMQGEKVDIVAMFDAVLPRGRHRDMGRLVLESIAHPFHMLRKAARHGQGFAQKALAAREGKKGGNELVELLLGIPGLVSGVEKIGTSGFVLDADLIAFRAAKESLVPWDVIHQDMGWAKSARATQFSSLEADHLGIVRQPHAKVLAEVIQRNWHGRK